MKFRTEILQAISQRLVELGMSSCSICGSESLNVRNQPVVLHVGGLKQENTGPDVTVHFYAAMECELCGHVHLFNSDRFHLADEPIFEQT